MTDMTIKTNNVPRELMQGYELTDSQRERFDYLTADELDCNSFVKYHGHVYDLGEFMRIDCDESSPLHGWHGAAADGYFSGALIKLSDDGETAVMGYYCS